MAAGVCARRTAACSARTSAEAARAAVRRDDDRHLGPSAVRCHVCRTGDRHGGACLADGIRATPRRWLKALFETLTWRTISAERMEVCRKHAARGNRPRDLSGHGSAGSQSEHHAFPRRRADAVLARVNYGMDTSPEGRLVMKKPAACYGGRAWATARRPIFPIQIFRVKEGVNYNEGDPNYDLFKLAVPLLAPSACSRISHSWMPRSTCSITSRAIRKPRSPTWAAARVLWRNVYDPDPRGHAAAAATCRSRPSTCRGLPSAATATCDLFFEQPRLQDADLVIGQLLERLRDPVPQARAQLPVPDGRRAYGWIPKSSARMTRLREVLKHGTLTIGFIGLAECLKALTGAAPRRERRGAAPWP